MIIHSILRPVEQSIILFFVLLELNGKGRGYTKGIKALAVEIGRHEKSVQNAIDSLRDKGLLTTQKNQNTVRIEHTLSDEELYSRMAFIDYLFCYSRPIQELENDLTQEIARLEEEVELAKEEIVRKEVQNRIRDFVIQQISQEDIELLTNRILAERTFETADKTVEGIIEFELGRFREEMFSKYGGGDETEDVMYYS